MTIKFSKKTLLLIVLVTSTVCAQLHAAEYDWNNSGSSFNAAASYSTTAGAAETTAPSTTTAVYFKTLTIQPILNAGITVAGLNIQVSGFDLTAASTGYGLTLSGYGTTATGTSASSEAAVYSTGTGTNTFDVPVTLASSSGATPVAPSTIYQTGVGGSLIFNGVISGTTSLAINLPATSTVAFNAANTYSGGTTLTGTNVTGGAATLALGNDSALGTGSLTFGSSNATIAATGGARTIANALVLGTNSSIGGTNNFTFTGTTTASNAVSRTLMVSNTGTTTFSGNVYLSDLAATGRTLTINGTGAVLISAPVADFNGAGGTTGNLAYSGTNTLTLSGANTYSGTTTVGSTTVTGGILTVTSTGVLGGGNVTINNGNTLTLGTGVTNAIANTATLTLGTTASGANAILALNGTMGTSQETVNGLIVNGAAEPAGKYGSTSDTTAGITQLANITGAGELTVLTTVSVPEPSTWALLVGSLGLLGAVTRRSHRRRA